MSKLSYFPPTTEEDAASMANVSLKEIKKLKKEGYLIYNGKLICNLSLEEYINGGCGYDDVLSYTLQKKIDEKIVESYNKTLFQKKITTQMIELEKKKYITIEYKNKKLINPINSYSIKSVEWNKIVFEKVEDGFNKIGDTLIKKLSYTHHTDYIDSRYDKTLKEMVRNIKQMGMVGLLTKKIDTEVEKLQCKESEVLEIFKSFESEKQSDIGRIKELKKFIDNCDKSIYNEIMVDSNSQRKTILEEELQSLMLNENFSQYSEFVDTLNVSNEIRLWNIFKTSISGKNSFGYSDFVDEFNDRDKLIPNTLLKSSDVLKVVNETKRLFKQSSVTDYKLVVSELSDKLNWKCEE
jgi:hypothetical protein